MWHLSFSLIKSAVRMLAGIELIMSHVQHAGYLLIAAECLGVIEEFYE